MIRDTINSLLKGMLRKANPVQWHNLRSVTPVSNKFGFERGTPIDRYYIEKFLEENKIHIKGKVLEIAESTYSKKFDNGVTSFEILSYDKDAKNSTLHGDLEKPETLPENFVDCFICTQTLNFTFDVGAAIESCYKVLKPGGTLLATVAGLCQISSYDMNRWGDYWRFTDLSIRKLIVKKFSEKQIKIQSFGNVLAATAIIHGISSEEFNENELMYRDPVYQVIITAIATK